MAQCAFDALGRPARITVVPPAVLRTALAALGVVRPRKANLLRFVTWGLLHDAVGEPTGNRHLSEFYRGLADGART